MTTYRSPFRRNLDKNLIEILDLSDYNSSWKQIARRAVERPNDVKISYKVEAIRTARITYHLSLKEAKDLVDTYMDEVHYEQEQANKKESTHSDIHIQSISLGNVMLEIRRRADGMNDIQVVSHQKYGLSDHDVMNEIVKLAREFN